jgi:hypothetical protein
MKLVLLVVDLELPRARREPRRDVAARRSGSRHVAVVSGWDSPAALRQLDAGERDLGTPADLVVGQRRQKSLDRPPSPCGQRQLAERKFATGGRRFTLFSRSRRAGRRHRAAVQTRWR